MHTHKQIVFMFLQYMYDDDNDDSNNNNSLITTTIYALIPIMYNP